MKETDNIKMEINIAGESLRLTVPFLSQDLVRDAEKRVNDLFKSWTRKYPGMYPNQIMAMVSYEFARLYCELLEQTNSAIQMADAAQEHLADIIRRNSRKRINAIPDEFELTGKRKKTENPPFPYMTDGEAEVPIAPLERKPVPDVPDDSFENEPGEEDSESNQTSFYTSY